MTVVIQAQTLQKAPVSVQSVPTVKKTRQEAHVFQPTRSLKVTPLSQERMRLTTRSFSVRMDESSPCPKLAGCAGVPTAAYGTELFTIASKASATILRCNINPFEARVTEPSTTRLRIRDHSTRITRIEPCCNPCLQLARNLTPPSPVDPTTSLFPVK